MRVLVCGGRGYNNRARVFAALDAMHWEKEIDLLIHGACLDGNGRLSGADGLAEEWACAREVPYLGVPAKWQTSNAKRGAGPARNHMMLKRGKPEIVIAFPGGRGTANMIVQAEREGIEVITLE